MQGRVLSVFIGFAAAPTASQYEQNRYQQWSFHRTYPHYQ